MYLTVKIFGSMFLVLFFKHKPLLSFVVVVLELSLPPFPIQAVCSSWSFYLSFCNPCFCMDPSTLSFYDHLTYPFLSVWLHTITFLIPSFCDYWMGLYHNISFLYLITSNGIPILLHISSFTILSLSLFYLC